MVSNSRGERAGRDARRRASPNNRERSMLPQIMHHAAILHGMTRSLVLAFALTCFATSARAQAVDVEEKAVIAVADSVLAALSSGDNATLTRLTLDSAVVGGAGLR